MRLAPAFTPRPPRTSLDLSQKLKFLKKSIKRFLYDYFYHHNSYLRAFMEVHA